MSEYTISGGGSHAPSAQRSYQEPGRELLNLSVRYLEREASIENTVRKYDLATEMARGISAAAAEASSILIHPSFAEHPRRQSLGLLVSALHERAPEPYIVFDLETDADLVGYSSSKPFINLGSVGTSFGHGARGLTVNAGTCGDGAGMFARCIVNTGVAKNGFGISAFAINAGRAGDGMGAGSFSSLIVNLGIAGERFASGAEGSFIIMQEPASYGIPSITEGGTQVPRSFYKARDLPTLVVGTVVGMKNTYENAMQLSPACEQFLERFAADARADPARICELYGSPDSIRATIKALVEP